MSCSAIAVTLLLLTSTAFSQPKRIGALGSSTVSGTGASVADSNWVNRLKKLYKDVGVIDTIHRVSANGLTCYDGMPTGYVPPPDRPVPNTNYNITRLLSRTPKPTHIVVSYPSNGYDIFSTEEILFCLETIRNTALAEGVVCYIASTQPREDPSRWNTLEKRERLKFLRDTIMQHFGEFAIDYWTELADPVTLKRKTEYAYIPDLIHYNDRGHEYIFKTTFEKDILNMRNAWTGAVSSEWENPVNWSRGIVPNSSHLVIVRPAANPAIIQSNVTLNHLLVEEGASLTVSPGFRLQLTR